MIIKKISNKKSDFTSNVIIQCQNNNNLFFHIQLDFDEYWFVQTQPICIIEGDKDLDFGDEILKISYMGNEQDLLNLVGKLNLKKITFQGISRYSGEILGIFHYNVYKYSLFVNLVEFTDNNMIEIIIKMADEYKLKFWDEMLQFIAYLRKNLMEILLNK